MAQTMRGMRLGTQSLESEVGVEFYGRTSHSYRCANNHDTVVKFAVDAEAPTSWACRHCALDGVLLKDGVPVELIPDANSGPRTHFEMLLERRSREELEELVQERLTMMRARRARGEAVS